MGSKYADSRSTSRVAPEISVSSPPMIPAIATGRRRRDAHAAEDARGIARAEVRRGDVDRGAARDRAGRRLARCGLGKARLAAQRARELARDARVREEVRAVERDLEPDARVAAG